MAHKTLKLKSFLYISCFCISLLPIVLYVLISMFTYGRGLDTVNRANLIKSILDFHDKKSLPLDGTKVVESRSLVPPLLNSCLPAHLENGRLYRSAVEFEQGEVKSVFFLVKQQIGNKVYIAYHIMPKREADIFIKPEVISTLWILAGSSIVLMGALIIFIKAIINKVQIPINRLENWANNLSAENLDHSLPYLAYPELYNIAELIRSKFAAEYERIESEERFWKFCSHELRTPISVMRVGIDLLQKYADNGTGDPGKLTPVILKLKKSAHTLSHTIESILWLNRENCELAAQEVDLSCLISEIVNDFKQIYLIDQCNLNIYARHYVINQPELAVRIVLENLIRNAFQHSIGEEIHVIQSRGTVKIINKLMPSHLEPSNTGFGLGRQLITRLTNRLGWELRFMSNESHYIVIVKFD